VYKDVRYNFY